MRNLISVKGIDSTIRSIERQLKEKAKSSVNEKIPAIVNSLKEATPVDTGTARDGWQVEGNTIVNKVDYISHLNEGSSQQAPSRFVEKTVLAHKGVSPSGIIVKDI